MMATKVTISDPGKGVIHFVKYQPFDATVFTKEAAE